MAAVSDEEMKLRDVFNKFDYGSPYKDPKTGRMVDPRQEMMDSLARFRGTNLESFPERYIPNNNAFVGGNYKQWVNDYRGRGMEEAAREEEATRGYEIFKDSPYANVRGSVSHLDPKRAMVMSRYLKEIEGLDDLPIYPPGTVAHEFVHVRQNQLGGMDTPEGMRAREQYQKDRREGLMVANPNKFSPVFSREADARYWTQEAGKPVLTPMGSKYDAAMYAKYGRGGLEQYRPKVKTSGDTSSPKTPFQSFRDKIGFASGGITQGNNMNETGIAALAAKGRGSDSLLVHMAPSELAALQAMAQQKGLSLTINPKTGLAEVGILSKLLPMAAGAATMAFTGNPWGAALAGGLTTKLTNPRAGILSMGLGALGGYGGANLFSSIEGLGAEALSIDEEARMALLREESAQLMAPYTTSPLYTASPPISSQDLSSLQYQDYGVRNPEALASTNARLGMPSADFVTPVSTPTSVSNNPFAQEPNPGDIDERVAGTRSPIAPTQMEKLRAGINSLSSDPSALWQAGGKFDSKTAAKNAAAFAPLLGMTGGTGTLNTSGIPGLNAVPKAAVPYNYMQARNPYWVEPSEANGWRGAPGQAYFNQDFTRAAQGGIMGMAEGGYTYNPNDQTYASDDVPANTATYNLPAVPIGFFNDMITSIMTRQMPQNYKAAPVYKYHPDEQSYTKNAAQGGIMGLHYAAGGTLLDGPGDGVSDSIPATINPNSSNPQKAALATGEFVIPARIVSELGNGDTKAGARHLYSMLDRIQKTRGKTIGKNKIAVDSKAARYLPA